MHMKIVVDQLMLCDVTEEIIKINYNYGPCLGRMDMLTFRHGHITRFTLVWPFSVWIKKELQDMNTLI